MKRSYSSPEAFKQSLGQRLHREAIRRNTDLTRVRQIFVYERFLARVILAFPDGAAILKGGLALELRLEGARATKDVDLRLMGSPDEALERLAKAGGLDLGDFLSFRITAHTDHPTIQAAGMPYEGRRYQAMAVLAGRPFGDPFRVYPAATHLAEKLHAYTLPRINNSRVKDLPVTALLSTVWNLSASTVAHAIDATFLHRKTHEPPERLPRPPPDWAGRYARIVLADQLPWPDLDSAFSVASTFVDPVLSGLATGLWRPDRRVWCEFGDSDGR